MIIDVVSDLHGFYPELEGGDLLIVAGDLTAHDTHEEMLQFCHWTMKQKYRTVIFIAGNHDNCLVGNDSMHQGPNADIGNPDVAYLIDNGIEFEGLKIWGSPWTKSFPGMNPKAKAFTLDTEEELAEKWALIPDDVDILVTHSPPWGMMDGPDSETRYGSTSLLRRKTEIGISKIKLHVFGHIHEGYGQFDIRKVQKAFGDPLVPVCVNASHVNENYEPVNKPIRVIL